MKNDPIERKLAELDEADAAAAAGQQRLRSALADRSNIVVAKAAKRIARAGRTDLLPDVVRAFERLVAKGSEADKGCTALQAIATALVEMEYDGAEPFLAGIRHVQRESVFGGSVDAAADLRSICAIGLVNTNYPKTLDSLAALLADPEWTARAGAARALGVAASGGPGAQAAALLLRYKAQLGDEERDVVAECLAGLLGPGDAAIEFVAARMESANEEIAEAAALALAGTRSEAAFEALKNRWERARPGAFRKTIVTAMASMRVEAAVAFVKKLAAGEHRDAIEALKALGIE
jgi:HEAT repeat protein